MDSITKIPGSISNLVTRRFSLALEVILAKEYVTFLEFVFYKLMSIFFTLSPSLRQKVEVETDVQSFRLNGS